MKDGEMKFLKYITQNKLTDQYLTYFDLDTVASLSLSLTKDTNANEGLPCRR